jgi:hypothetical protein
VYLCAYVCYIKELTDFHETWDEGYVTENQQLPVLFKVVFVEYRAKTWRLFKNIFSFQLSAIMIAPLDPGT